MDLIDACFGYNALVWEIRRWQWEQIAWDVERRWLEERIRTEDGQ